MTPDDDEPPPDLPEPAFALPAPDEEGGDSEGEAQATDAPSLPTLDPPAQSPHDGLFRRIFSDPHHARALLRALLPKTFVQNADWTTLTLESGAFVDASLRQSTSDLLFSVEVAGVLTLVQLLVEHQSTPHAQMAWRVLGYQTRACEQWLTRAESSGPLPVVIPIVVYCGERPWNAPLDLEPLYGPLDALGSLTRCVPRTSYLLDDLTTISTAGLVARGIPAAGTLALWALRSVARRDGPRTVRHIAHLFDELLRTRSGADAVGTILRYLASSLRDEDRPLLDDTLAQLSPPSKEHTMRTIADAYQDEARKEGLQEGRQEGRQQQAALVLLKLLTLKFGPLGESTEARISSASLEDLDQFTERVLSATSVDEVLS